MRIAIDARMYNESGIGRYIRNLLNYLQKLDEKNEYFILHLKDDYERVSYHNKNFHKLLADFDWYGVREQVKLPKLLKSLKPDLVHFPHFNVPIFYQGKFVVTIHDLIHQHFTMQRATTHGPLIYKLKQFGYKQVFKHAIKNSQKILVPSQFVKKQLMDKWGVVSGKIMVTPEAVDEKILKLKENVSIHHTLPPIPYLFYVGNAHPHKNVEGLIKAFLKLKMDSRLRGNDRGGLKLVLAGHDHYFWQRVKKEYHDKDIKYLGYVSDDELVRLYKSALCFILPSYEEGFGIPILEAFALSCPVVSSSAGSLKEVGGDAAIYFDPHNLTDMTNKISRIIKDENLKKEMVEKGLKRVKLFSWKKLVEQTLGVYQQCA